jgi:hypothetical protein
MRTPLVASLLLSAACSSAYADRVATAQATPLIAIDTAPAKVRAPYDVQIVREDGDTEPTYAFKDRYYVEGSAGERYTIRVTNPTPRRVEAVVTVDGLDVVDGENGDLRKRGYIVPPYGTVNIDGFRTSLDDVATFRFSSVDNSYAGQKGKARNVGVIAVAIFEEAAPPPEQQIVAPRPYRYEDDIDARDEEAPRATRGGYAKGDTAKADKRPAPPPAEAPAAPGAVGGAPSGGAGRVAEAPAIKSAAPRHEAYDEDGEDGGEYTPAPRTNRPGLGTEYGESRYSSASYTRFVRAANRPIAIAELRYNDTAGLVALGIPVTPIPDEGELMTRETADPFPGDSHFARPAR